MISKAVPLPGSRPSTSLLVFIIFFVASASPLLAHQPDKVDHNSVLKVKADGTIELEHSIVWGDNAAWQVKKDEIDLDRDGRISPEEEEGFLAKVVSKAREGLRLEVNKKGVRFQLHEAKAFFDDRQITATSFYIRMRLYGEVGRLSGRASTVTFFDGSQPPPRLCGDHQLRVEADGLVLHSQQNIFSTFNPVAVVSSEIIAAPPGMKVKGMGREPKAKEVEGRVSPEKPQKTLEAESRDTLRDYLKRWREGEASPLFILLAFGVAFLLGAGHALSPGHGKAMVAGYLIGSRGRIRDAVFLGLIVTGTHVFTVVLLAVLMWQFSNIIRQEDAIPWLSLASGMIIFFFGMVIFSRGGRPFHEKTYSHGLFHRHSHEIPRKSHAPHEHSQGDFPSYGHTHPHSHPHSRHPHPPKGEGSDGVSLKDLLVLGISGGMVPCPSALVVLLCAIGFAVPYFGLLLVLFFSAGLAMVLMILGVLMVVAKNVMARFTGEGRLLRILPRISGVLVTLVGLGIALRGAEMLGLITIHWRVLR